jgi:hypothetical protein
MPTKKRGSRTWDFTRAVIAVVLLDMESLNYLKLHPEQRRYP